MRRKEEFGEALRHGRRAGTRRLNAHLATSTGHSGGGVTPSREPRVGFVVSRAVGSAVVRNKVRRRLRGLIRDRIVDLPEAGLLVVRVHPPAATATFAELRSDLDRVLTRLLTPVSPGDGIDDYRARRTTSHQERP
jgi:ribonuclease P protein component